MIDIYLILLILLLSILSVWIKPLPVGKHAISIWPIFYALLVTALLLFNAIRPIAFVALILLPTCSVLQAHDSLHPWFRTGLEVLTIAICFAMAIRLWPGFPEVILVQDARLSEDSATFRLTAHIDAGVAGLFMLAIYAKRITSLHEVIRAIRPTLQLALLTTFCVLSTAVVIGYMRFDPKFPSFAILYLMKTLLWTCVVEECFFRGIIQERLMRKGWYWSAILVSAVLFGLAHFRGGWPLVALAGLAGLGYGWAYALTRRIEAAMVVHLVLNAIHFFLFTYPRIEGAS